jgi:hypothetical protein
VTLAGHNSCSKHLSVTAAAAATICCCLLLLLLCMQLSVPGQGLQVEFTQPGYIQDGSKQVATFGPTLRLRR